MSRLLKTPTAAPAPREVLTVDSLEVRYGLKTVVSSASLTAYAGQVLAISGRSGVGKSSLLFAVAGLVPAFSGSISLNGTLIHTLDERRLTMCRRHMGFVFQDAALFEEMSVLDNVSWVGRLRGLNRKTARVAAVETLSALGVMDLMARRPGEISGGEAQRVNIARAMTGGVQLLLVDEPTAALDGGTSASVCEILADVTHNADLATLVVSHDPIVLAHADRHHTMVDGVLSM